MAAYRLADKWIQALSPSRNCPESWESMIGGDRERVCARCRAKVLNAGGMPEDHVLSLLGPATLVRRRDGKLMRKGECRPRGGHGIAMLLFVASLGVAIALSYIVVRNTQHARRPVPKEANR
ncbi:MAG: hypothetical protein KBF88_17065 [Polyangiaceae bacterium]|nr:hypothetical protein [Polyangiaceae bacterium]